MKTIADKISKEDFDIAYDNHMPSKWICLAYKFFSTSTEKKNMYIRKNISYILMGLFLLGFFGTVFNAPKAFVATSVIILSILLVVLALFIFSAGIANNYRIKQIRKELGITRDEYNALVEIYYD